MGRPPQDRPCRIPPNPSCRVWQPWTAYGRKRESRCPDRNFASSISTLMSISVSPRQSERPSGSLSLHVHLSSSKTYQCVFAWAARPSSMANRPTFRKPPKCRFRILDNASFFIHIGRNRKRRAELGRSVCRRTWFAPAVIAQRLRTVLPQRRFRVFDQRQQLFRLLGADFHMLRRHCIGARRSLGQIFCQNDCTIIPDRLKYHIFLGSFSACA